MNAHMHANRSDASATHFMPGRSLLLQRQCACGSSTGASGECAACANKRRLQAKLSIGASNDPMEQEADRVADQVLAAPVHPAVNTAPNIQRAAGQASGVAGTAPASVDRVLASAGRPLESGLQQDMGQRFGYDFSQVRVHSGASAEQSARDINAKAYTAGNNVVFGAGQLAPGTHQGRHLLAHELTHVVQQGSGVSTKLIQGSWDWERAAVGAAIGGVGGALVGGLAGAAVGAAAGGVIGGLSGAAAKEKKTVTIQPVAVANDDGKSPTAIPSFADAKSIWGKCCVDLTINATKQVNKAAFKELEAPLDCAPKNEALALANAAAINGTSISVFVPDTFKDGGTAGKDVHGGGFATHANTSNPKVFIVSGADGTVVAHELGHAMGHASCLGKSGHQPAGTVMEPSGAHDKPVPKKVAAAVCTNVRSFSGASGSGKTDCTEDLT